MPNGQLQVGRATNTVFAGRAMPPLSAGTGVGASYATNSYGFPSGWLNSSPWSPAAWGRSGGMCQPIQQCCCLGPVNIGPGETLPIIVNWAGWLDGLSDYRIGIVDEASLLDPMSMPPMQPADPELIRVLGVPQEPGSGRAGSMIGCATIGGVLYDNSDVAGGFSIIPPYGTQVLVQVDPTARLGAQYKLDFCITARDCDGRQVRKCECVVIVVQEC